MLNILEKLRGDFILPFHALHESPNEIASVGFDVLFVLQQIFTPLNIFQVLCL